MEYGFRLPSALDNRPLKFEEFEALAPQTIYVSATPGNYELEKSGGDVVDQVVRPTGLLDPLIEVRPVAPPVDALFSEIRQRAAINELRTGHHTDQADGVGSYRISRRTWRARALSALRYRHRRTYGDYPRLASG
ncbi:hypothetical protein BKL61_11990 [Staphylococcus epidermidis]|nr:hypothetical protein BKL61_11990 [Staphylococcus epidermidis]